MTHTYRLCRIRVRTALSNDNFADRATISGDSGTATANYALSTLEAGEPTGGDRVPVVAPFGSAWYRWTSTVNGSLVLSLTDTFAPNPQYGGLLINAYEDRRGTLAGLGALRNVSEFVGSSNSVQEFRVIRGVAYAIQVAVCCDEYARREHALSWRVQGAFALRVADCHGETYLAH